MHVGGRLRELWLDQAKGWAGMVPLSLVVVLCDDQRVGLSGPISA